MAILDDADGAETRESPRDANDAVVVDAMSEGATPTARGGADARDDDGDDDETSTRKLLPNDAATTTSDATTTTTRERAEDDLERELDAVVDGGRDDAGASGDGDEESQRAAPGDAFDRYLQPKFWMTLGDVKIFVSLWTIYCVGADVDAVGRARTVCWRRGGDLFLLLGAHRDDFPLVLVRVRIRDDDRARA